MTQEEKKTISAFLMEAMPLCQCGKPAHIVYIPFSGRREIRPVCLAVACKVKAAKACGGKGEYSRHRYHYSALLKVVEGLL